MRCGEKTGEEGQSELLIKPEVHLIPGNSKQGFEENVDIERVLSLNIN